MYLIKGDEKVLQLIDQKFVAINFIVEIELLGWKYMTAELEAIISDLIKDIHYFDYSYRVKQRTITLRQKYNFKLQMLLLPQQLSNLILHWFLLIKYFLKSMIFD